MRDPHLVFGWQDRAGQTLRRDRTWGILGTPGSVLEIWGEYTRLVSDADGLPPALRMDAVSDPGVKGKYTTPDGEPYVYWASALGLDEEAGADRYEVLRLVQHRLWYGDALAPFQEWTRWLGGLCVAERGSPGMPSGVLSWLLDGGSVPALFESDRVDVNRYTYQLIQSYIGADFLAARQAAAGFLRYLCDQTPEASREAKRKELQRDFNVLVLSSLLPPKLAELARRPDDPEAQAVLYDAAQARLLRG